VLRAAGTAGGHELEYLTIHGHRRVYDRLTELGFDGEIMREFGAVIVALEEWSDTTASYGT